MMSNKIVLCTDLDRTLLPNGEQPESSYAREAFQTLVDRPEVDLVYVSGRSLAMVAQAIDDFGIPIPNFAITDVGTKIYQLSQCDKDISSTHLNQAFSSRFKWTELNTWQSVLDHSVSEDSFHLIRATLRDLKFSRLQPEHQQARHKVSFITSQRLVDRAAVEIALGLEKICENVAVVTSVNEFSKEGLIDVVPQCSGKLFAIHHLVESLRFKSERVVFSGDSGNDMEVLLSGYKSILVKNSTEEIKSELRESCHQRNALRTTYFAGGLNGYLNGNYASGIVEGCMHFFPEVSSWLDPDKIQTMRSSKIDESRHA